MPIAHKYHTTTHGNAAFADADIIAVAESWAEHVARSFAHFKYGNNNSLTNYPTYIEFLEKQRDESFNHIPIGLYYDLTDGINISETSFDGAWANTGTVFSINDNVSGLTNAQLFNLLDANSISPSVFIQRLNNSGIVQPPNSVSDINNLFNSY